LRGLLLRERRGGKGRGRSGREGKGEKWRRKKAKGGEMEGIDIDWPDL